MGQDLKTPWNVKKCLLNVFEIHTGNLKQNLHLMFSLMGHTGGKTGQNVI